VNLTKGIFFITVVVCALTASVAATAAIPSLSVGALPTLTETGFQPLGDPIEDPNPPPLLIYPSP